jgi:hypothetical protein
MFIKAHQFHASATAQVAKMKQQAMAAAICSWL